jgi:serine/threonine protein kinase
MAEKNIENLIAQGKLAEAFAQFGEFLKLCEYERQELTQSQGRFANMESQVNAATVGNEANIERNRISMSFQTQLDDFRRDVLSVYFEMADREQIFEGFTSRDQIIHEILNLRLRPKRYRWEEKLVEGNSSIVYRLQNVDTPRHAVALVLKTPELTDEARKEIDQLGDLRHRNVIKLLDQELNNFPYFVITEYVHGTTLPDAIGKTGPRPAAQAVDWLYQLTEALDYLRHKRILHTNVRPSKIFIDDEWQIMISPFDLHKVSTGESSFNRYLDVCRYGSPELVQKDGVGLDLDAMCASDQYSLGLLGYKMLTGEDLFEGNSVFEILESRKRFTKADYRRARFNRLPKDSFDLKVGGSKNLVGIMQQLLQEDPLERFRNLHQLLRALHPFTRADIVGSSLARQSYRRCLAVNKNLMQDFYQIFMEKHSASSNDFTNLGRQRQSAMLQMAIDVLLDIDEKGALLKNIAGSTQHSKYQSADFALFLEVLVETLQKNDPEWQENISDAWKIICEKAMAIIESR